MKSAQQEECVLCCRDISIYATGICDHSVCYECSTRMRVLCETNDCPICRSSMPLVVFTHEKSNFQDVYKKFTLKNKKYSICFEDEIIELAFKKLLENKCEYCQKTFQTFRNLQDHIRREHEYQYCELCVANLKIFPFERKGYSRKDLARHRRKGDPDDTSHRGHPDCEFCQTRFVDKDDLYRHLRKEHYFCHFCDIDGKNDYYENYETLKVHFRRMHYLCEEGDCAIEQFVGAFRTEIDLKAHIAKHHSRHKSKQEAKQARVLDVDISFAARPSRLQGNGSPRSGKYNTQSRRRNINETISNTQGLLETENIDTQSVQEFPYLSEDCVDSTASYMNNNVKEKFKNALQLHSFNKNPALTKKNVSSEDFPALGATASNIRRPNFQNGSASTNAGKMGGINVPEDDFPALGMTHLSNERASWLNNSSLDSSQNNTLSAAANTKKVPCKALTSDRGKNVQNQSKWMSNKSAFNFNDEFPCLKTKKNSTPAQVPIRPSSPEIQPSKFLQGIMSEQFVVVKKKSKKSKPVKAVPPTVAAKFLEEHDQDDKFKANMIHPIMLHTPEHNIIHSNWEQEASFTNSDFPPLAMTKCKPSGLNNYKKQAVPPPGFSTTMGVDSNEKPLTLASLAQLVMPSGGDKKSNGVVKKPVMPETFQQYLNPPDMEQRNSNLIVQICELLNNDVSSFQAFKDVSRQFRRDELSADDYYEKCLKILGEKGFHELFLEMVSLLPDIKKQQELLTVHNQLSSQSKGSLSQIRSCELCFQVLFRKDFKSHLLNHDHETNW